jgi:hypothetical protein
MRSFFPPHIILGVGKQQDLKNQICQTVEDANSHRKFNFSKSEMCVYFEMERVPFKKKTSTYYPL